jgi:heterodisulfide reductase subunit C1
MGKLYDKLMQDYRIKEGLKACINCGTCTAVCPAAEFYKYNPKNIVNIVQTQNEEKIEELLKNEFIWYCGECMSCVTRCPRRNAPGLIVMALRSLSVELGYFVESEKGRQQYPVTKVLCGNILKYGYCVYPRTFKYKYHPEWGTVGEWIENNMEDVFERAKANFEKEGPGVLRKISDSSLHDLQNIFDVTGATEKINKLTEISLNKAAELGMSEEDYFIHTFTYSSDKHFNNK